MKEAGLKKKIVLRIIVVMLFVTAFLLVDWKVYLGVVLMIMASYLIEESK